MIALTPPMNEITNQALPDTAFTGDEYVRVGRRGQFNVLTHGVHLRTATKQAHRSIHARTLSFDALRPRASDGCLAESLRLKAIEPYGKACTGELTPTSTRRHVATPIRNMDLSLVSGVATVVQHAEPGAATCGELASTHQFSESVGTH